MIQLVYVRGGRMVGGDHFSLPREGSEPAGDVLAEFLTQYYQEGNLIPRNILVQGAARRRATPIRAMATAAEGRGGNAGHAPARREARFGAAGGEKRP